MCLTFVTIKGARGGQLPRNDVAEFRYLISKEILGPFLGKDGSGHLGISSSCVFWVHEYKQTMSVGQGEIKSGSMMNEFDKMVLHNMRFDPMPTSHFVIYSFIYPHRFNGK